MTKKDWDELIELLENSEPRPYKMFIGAGMIQFLYDEFGKEGLIAWAKDPNYEYTFSGLEAAELFRKLTE